MRDKEIGQRVVPIIPDEAARSAWTRCSRGRRSTPRSARSYEPVDRELLLSYKEAQDGQILEEGITEAGSMASSSPPARRTPRTASR
jgi:pyruvate dehydrogenase E1 component